MQYMTDGDGDLADYFEFNVDLLGQVLKKEDRASEIISGIEGILSDLRGISGTSDQNVYIAGVTISGSNTLNTTFPVYIPFDLTGTSNAYQGSTENKVVLRVEAFTTMDIDMMIVDPSSSDKVGEADSQYLMEYVYRLNSDSDPSNDIPIYITVPIVWDSVNYDCALASSYYVAHLVHGCLTDQEVEDRIVPQSTPVSRMSVFDAVLVGRKPYMDWFASDEDLSKVSDVIDALGMSDLSLKYLDEISGGEFQKVQIARAIVQEPSVLILDEPTNNLDISNQHRTMSMIMDAVRSRGMCTMMTMHDINLAAHYSDRFLFFRDGCVAVYGGPEIITEDLIRDVYGMEVDVLEHRGVPMVVPKDSPRYCRG